MFPTSLHRHPSSADRTTSHDWANVLYFHVGNAIVTFYDAVLGTEPADWTVGKPHRSARRHRQARPKQLHGASAATARLEHDPQGIQRCRSCVSGRRNTETDTDVENGAD
jgi:hypothetical protein